MSRQVTVRMTSEEHALLLRAAILEHRELGPQIVHGAVREAERALQDEAYRIARLPSDAAAEGE